MSNRRSPSKEGAVLLTVTVLIFFVYRNQWFMPSQVAVASGNPTALSQTPVLPRIILDEAAGIQLEARKVLGDSLLEIAKKGNNDSDDLKQSPFENVNPSLYLHQTFLTNFNQFKDASKSFIGSNTIKSTGKDFIVYGGGINGKPAFENNMVELGASVFGFDCTISYDEAQHKFKFYDWCIGKQTDFNGIKYTESHDAQQRYKFYSLKQIMKQLGHKKIDMLKLDVEGAEWDILYSEIIQGRILPQQLIFELHTQGSNPNYVPESLAAGKTRRAVEQLFADLFDVGYRVLSKDINPGDIRCAEFALVNVLF